MAAQPWNIRELLILLNICNERSVGLSLYGSFIAPKKLVLKHIRAVPILDAVGDPDPIDLIELSDDVCDICKFLGVLPSSFLNLDHQFQSHEEVFKIVVEHQFFHISNMTMRLGLLQIRPAGSPMEYFILDEFMSWWFQGGNVHHAIPKSGCLTYAAVTTMVRRYFDKVLSDWEIDHLTRHANHTAELQIDNFQRPSEYGVMSIGTQTIQLIRRSTISRGRPNMALCLTNQSSPASD